MMTTLSWVKRLIVAGVVALTLGGAATTTAHASEPYCPPGYVLKKVVSYQTVVAYETRVESYTVCVTKYDHCYKPYHVYEKRYRDVQVPVKKQVAVAKYVKVPVY
jgi:hypothetical protein